MARIKEISIKNFRGFEEMKVENFKQINLIVGKNNSGKSTLLESIFLSVGISNPILPDNINKIRGIGLKSAEDLKYLFYKLRFSNIPTFNLKFDDSTERNLELHPKYLTALKNEKSQKNTDTNLLLSNATSAIPSIEGIDLKFNIKEIFFKTKNYISSFSITNQGINFNQAKDYHEKLFAVYISPDNKETNALVTYSEIIKRKKEKIVIDAIRSFDPKIRNIFPLNDGLYFDHEDFEERVPINLAGDGIRRFINIITTIAERPESIILIDEIENGLHYSAHSLLWKNIFSIAEQMNIQLFINTHSLETLQHFKEILDKEEYSSMRDKSMIFTLTNTSKYGIKALEYSYEGFKDAIELNNEIRN